MDGAEAGGAAVVAAAGAGGAGVSVAAAATSGHHAVDMPSAFNSSQIITSAT